MTLLTGKTQAMAFDFIRIKHAIGLEMKGLKLSQGSALKAAELKGYVPKSLIGRGSIDKRRQAAHDYMSYVVFLLTAGGFGRTYGEEIVTGVLAFDSMEDCGCPTFMPVTDRTNRIGLMPLEKVTMHICEKANA